jgi:hypothetical protein
VLRRSKWSGIGNAADPRRPLAGPLPINHSGPAARLRESVRVTLFASSTIPRGLEILKKICARRDSRFNSTAVAENFRIDSVLVATRLEAKAGMHDNLNIDQVFPIQDDVSAWLMCVKAELLHDAGIINAKELNVVIERATTKAGSIYGAARSPKRKSPG